MKNLLRKFAAFILREDIRQFRTIIDDLERKLRATERAIQKDDLSVLIPIKVRWDTVDTVESCIWSGGLTTSEPGNSFQGLAFTDQANHVVNPDPFLSAAFHDWFLGRNTVGPCFLFQGKPLVLTQRGGHTEYRKYHNQVCFEVSAIEGLELSSGELRKVLTTDMKHLRIIREL